MTEKITLEISTPNGLFKASFEKTTKVGDVIAVVVKDKDLAEGDTFELFHEGEALPVERPLVSFKFSGTVLLDLVATGQGV